MKVHRNRSAIAIIGRNERKPIKHKDRVFKILQGEIVVQYQKYLTTDEWQGRTVARVLSSVARNEYWSILHFFVLCMSLRLEIPSRALYFHSFHFLFIRPCFKPDVLLVSNVNEEVFEES